MPAVRKVQPAAGNGIPPDEMEGFVGAEATINTWRSAWAARRGRRT